MTLKEAQTGCFDYFKMPLKGQNLDQSHNYHHHHHLQMAHSTTLVHFIHLWPFFCDRVLVLSLFSISSKFLQFNTEKRREALLTIQLGSGIGNKL